jgi:hypothetical protein
MKLESRTRRRLEIERASRLFHRPDRDAVGVNHGGFQAGMTQQCLNNADVIACLQQVGCKAVPEGMGFDPLRDFRFAHGRIERFLKLGFMQMIAAAFAVFSRQRQGRYSFPPDISHTTPLCLLASTSGDITALAHMDGSCSSISKYSDTACAACRHCASDCFLSRSFCKNSRTCSDRLADSTYLPQKSKKYRNHFL